jgi:tight adherence protein B
VIPLPFLRWVGAVGVPIGLISVLSLFSDENFIVVRWFNQYLAFLDGYIQSLYLKVSAKAIAIPQIIALAVICIAGAMDKLPYWWAFATVAVIAPFALLMKQKSTYTTKLEMQVDGFVLAYANTLKSIPNPSAAMFAVVNVLQNPLKQEIDRALREMRVGSTLERALTDMSARVKNRTLDNALSAIFIGTQVGGNLPQVLATTAGVLREMQRLDGVVRTKTAQGRSQLKVLVVFPFGLMWVFSFVSPGYFDPLQSSFVGYIISGIAFAFWVASIAAARKILQVDI